MTHHVPSVLEFPTPLEVVLTREFEAPIELVFDVLTQPEHVRHHFPPFGEQMTVCEIDLRVGGDYHFVMVTADGIECSFRGTFLEVEPPHRTVQTWRFEGWQGVEAIETMELSESGGVTRLSYTLAFRDQAGRDHMTKYDGLESNFANIARYIETLVHQ